MSEFDKYTKYLNTLEDPNLDVAQQLIRTAGQGITNKKTYHPPTKDVIKKTLAMFDALNAFDANPSDETFATVGKTLAALEMKAVRVAGSPEWIYITPNADRRKEKDKWERISINTQFDLSWHVGSKSKVAASDEHNGGDGAFRVIGEMVASADNLKLIMSNSRKRSTSVRGKRYPADWAHSSQTIDYPVMRMLAGKGFSVINVHGMASRSYGLLVNNRTSFFTRSRSSLPTMIGIALTQFFRDSDRKLFVFGSELPGNIYVKGVKKPLTAPNNQNSSKDSIFMRAKGVHNTNTIGNLIHNVVANQEHVKPYKFDSGRSCHIEFGIVRDGRADLKRFIAAINLAAYWMNNYTEDLNPWKVIKAQPNFDMTNYGNLYPQNALLNAQIQKAKNANSTRSAEVVSDPQDRDEPEDIDALPVTDLNPESNDLVDPENDGYSENEENDLDEGNDDVVVKPVKPSLTALNQHIKNTNANKHQASTAAPKAFLPSGGPSTKKPAVKETAAPKAVKPMVIK